MTKTNIKPEAYEAAKRILYGRYFSHSPYPTHPKTKDETSREASDEAVEDAAIASANGLIEAVDDTGTGYCYFAPSKKYTDALYAAVAEGSE